MAVNCITANLNADKTLVFDQTTQVNSGENLSIQLKIAVNEIFVGFNFNLEFLLPNQQKYATGFIPLLQVEEEYFLTYTFDRSLLSQRGRVYLQLRGSKTDDTDTTEIFKSVLSADASFEVNPSIFDAQEPFLFKDALSDVFKALEEAQLLLDQIKADVEAGNFGGKDGETPEISAEAVTLEAGQPATVTQSGTTLNPVFTFGIPRGQNGKDGKSIVSIIKTNTNNLVDVYTITYSDGTTELFDVTNGATGKNGVTFTPFINQNGVLTWSRSDDGTEVPSPKPIIPKIGENGNWFLGETDLEVTATGQIGATGATGEKGTTFTPNVDSSGNLSWSNDGGLSNPSTVNVKGARGTSGSDGVTFTPYVDESGNLRWTRSDGDQESLPSPTAIIPQIGENGNWFLGETDLEVTATGQTGETGASGEKGTTFTPSVDSNGNLSWSNDGGLSNPSTVNIMGARGNLGFGIVNVTPTTELEYNDGDMENMLNTQISITTTSNNLRAGDTLICPYYNTDSFTYKIFAGEIKSFSISTKTATVLVKWFLT